MNRSLFNVLFGVMEGGSSEDADEIYASVRSTSAEDVAMLLETAQRDHQKEVDKFLARVLMLDFPADDKVVTATGCRPQGLAIRRFRR